MRRSRYPVETRACISCGREFVTPIFSTRIRHTRKCGQKRSPKTKSYVTAAHYLVFTAVDGEGVTDPATGDHEYVMLSVGTETHVRPDKGPLTFHDVFTALWAHFVENPKNVYVGFYLGYDFTQWMRSMPESVARELLTEDGIRRRRRKTHDGISLPPTPVRCGSWEFDILGSKRFKLRSVEHPVMKDGYSLWMYINDAGPFFQSSFVKAIDPAAWPKPIVTPEEYGIIKRGKEERATAVLSAEMEVYNRAENIALERLVGVLNEGLTAAGIRLDRDAWYGPGQAAQQWLNNIKAPLREEIENATPVDVLEAAQSSYYGGWFEIFAHGHVPGVSYEYDINSAYPYVISRLPDFRHGRWVQDRIGPSEPAGVSAPSLVHVTIHGDNLTCGPLPYRDERGKIYRPRNVKGWYWEHELDAATRAGLVDTVEVHDRWTFEPDDIDAHPFASIADMYQERLRVGKNSPHGKAYKLVYNSAYGKMAQSIGAPKYASALHASLITSGTRTMILDAIGTHPRGTDALLMVATDGVYFDTPHPSLPLSGTVLGGWDETAKSNLTLFMPGVYWDDDTRDRLRRDAGISLKSRGISAAALATQIEACDEAWSTFELERDGWPTMTVPLRFEMVTAKQALNRNDWSLAGTVRTPDHPGEKPLVKELSADPEAKRSFPYAWHDGPSGPRLTSTSYGRGAALESTPYSERFGRLLAADRDDRGLDADGIVMEDVMREIMRG